MSYAPGEKGIDLGTAQQGGNAALDAVLDDLLTLASGPAPPQWAALGSLVRRPRLVSRLDVRMRTPVWEPAQPTGRDPVTQPVARTGRDLVAQRYVARPSRAEDLRVIAAVARSTGTSPSPDERAPAGLFLAAMAGDGRLRDRAVAAIAADPAPELVPVLALRCGDWVGAVRERARAAMVRLLADPRYLRAVLPTAAYTAGRMRGRWVMDQVRTALAAAFDEVGPSLIGSRDAIERRVAYEVGAEQHRWGYDDLLRFALREPDPAIRSRTAEAAAAEAERRGDVGALRTLAGARFAQVRILGLVGLARLGRDADVAAAITDPAPLVRAYARSRATDAAARYREMLTSPAGAISPGTTPAGAGPPDTTPLNARPTARVAAVAGLGEVGGYADEALLAPLLDDADPRIRAAAVHALAALDCVPVARVVPLLRDPAAGVVREAAEALRPYRRLVPGDLPWELLADPRPELRRAGYRLLNGRDRGTRLRAALRLAADADPALARRGLADAYQLTVMTYWHTGPQPEPLPADRAGLVDLAAALDGHEELVDRIRRAPAE